MYVELHCHSNYSFQEGASSIDDLLLQARRLGYPALALTDHDNLCGAMEFVQSAQFFEIKPITGAEVTLAPPESTDPPACRSSPQDRAPASAPPVMPGGNHHLTLLAATPQGYSNLCRLLSYARVGPDPLDPPRDLRREPVLDPALLAEHAQGLIALSGCRSGEVPSLIAAGRTADAEAAARRYLEWFGSGSFYLELQHNLVYGDDERVRALIALGRRLGIPVVATNNVHYHVRSRHRLQDALVAIRACKTLEETHRERRPNSEFFLKSPEAMATLFAGCPQAIENTLAIAERCEFNLARDLDYRFPNYPVPQGHTPDSYLEHVCYEAARRRYGSWPLWRSPAPMSSAASGAEGPLTVEGAGSPAGKTSLEVGLPSHVHNRLQDELRLIRKHGLAGFLLIYHDVIQVAREVMRDLGLCPPHTPLEDCLPGRGRGSSVAMLTGYLIGLSHIDPLEYGLSLERFLPEELGVEQQPPTVSTEASQAGSGGAAAPQEPPQAAPGDKKIKGGGEAPPKLGYVPDIDLDFPRNIREELIKRVHARWGWDHAALSGMIDTYQTRGAVRDLGKVLALPPDEVDKLARRVEGRSARGLRAEMETMPDFRDKLTQPGWRDLIALAAQIDGFPRHLAQHPGGMIISSTPLIDLVPVQPSAIEGRYICQWDKDSIDDAGFVKIDFLSLGALSQMQDALRLIEQRRGSAIDLTRIDFGDEAVYDSLCQADTIGIFQVESAAQMQTIVRLRPRNLTDMAYEVGAVRPGVGANHGVAVFLSRRMGHQPVVYDHPLEEGPLQRTLGVILFQDQVNQLAMTVAGFSAAEADQLRRAFTRRNNKRPLATYWERFREGAAARGVDLESARKVFRKFNGEYMFPESHAFAFGVTAYHASWLKFYYPLEFYAGLFNQQPMGFYNLETLKEDARRHGVTVLNPDINRSAVKCTAEDLEGWSGVASPGDEKNAGGEGSLRIGLETVLGLGEKLATAIVQEREACGSYTSLAGFMERTGLPQRNVEDLVEAGAFDTLLTSPVAPAPSPAQGQGDDRARSPAPILPAKQAPGGEAPAAGGALGPGPDVARPQGPPQLPGGRPNGSTPLDLTFLPKPHVHVESGRRGGFDEGPVPSVFPYPGGGVAGPQTPRDGLAPPRGSGGQAPALSADGEPSRAADRRRGLQESALHHRTGRRSRHGYQLALPLPVEQDLLDLPPQSTWDRMEGEYRTMGLFPAGHVMAHLRRHLGENVAPSNMMERFPEGATVTTAGLIIRRQHPMAKAIFMTLEDEFGHIPVIAWLDVYQRYKMQFKEPFVIVTGQVSRRDGTFNIVAQRAESFRGNTTPPKAKSWS